MKELIEKLCLLPGVSGSEEIAAEFIYNEMSKYSLVEKDKNGNIIARLGSGKKRILFDAHFDQIGFIATFIDPRGFVKLTRVGGVDLRVLYGASVISCKDSALRGVICCLPPHLVKDGGSSALDENSIWADFGLNKDNAEKRISPGDKFIFNMAPTCLLNNRITSPALDNRAGCTALIRIAQLLSDKEYECSVMFLFSVKEETGMGGAKCASFALDADEAVAVDVTFAAAPGVSQYQSGIMGNGPMIGVAPSLDRGISSKLKELAVQSEIPFQVEVMGGQSGTNADVISTSKSGIRCGLLSIPIRNMHTQIEVAEISDIENTAKLLCEYIVSGGAYNG